MLYALGKFNTFVFTEDKDVDDYETVLEKLNTYFLPKMNVIHDFYLRAQMITVNRWKNISAPSTS